MMNFGMKIQILRKENRLSQEALAEKLDVSRQAVSKWETGEGYPEIDKIILISELFQVSLDYLLKDGDVNEVIEVHDFMSHQKVEDYISFKKQFALRIAASISAIILSVTFPIAFYDKNEGLGIFAMLFIVALAVGCIIVTGISNEQYKDLENKEMNLSYQDYHDLQSQQTQFKTKFGIGIAFGVFLIIASVSFIGLIETYFHNDTIFAPIQLMICIAIAVFVFVYLGILDNTYQFLVQNKAYVRQRKQDKENDDLFAITMPLAAAIYLSIGFLKNWWHPGWIIFPITAILTQCYATLLKRMNND